MRRSRKVSFYLTLDFDKFTHIYINLDLNEKVLPEMESFPLRHPCVNRFPPVQPVTLLLSMQVLMCQEGSFLFCLVF